MRIPAQKIIWLSGIVLILAGAYALATATEGSLYVGNAGAQEIARSCAKSSAAQAENCYSQAFRVFAKEHGPVEAFSTLLALQKIDPAANGCHFIAHGIGYGTYERDPDTWHEDFRTINQACTYGAMHGILELALAALPGGLTPEVLPEICGATPRGDCNHIVGHLALVEKKDSVLEALALCRVLKDQAQYEHCSSGVFMEEETAFNLINHGLADESYLNWPARIPELTRLCKETVSGRDGVMCWKEMAHVFASAARGDAEKAFAYCQNGPGADATQECMTHTIGIVAASRNFAENQLASVCDAFEKYADEELCVRHMISSLLSSKPEATEAAVRFCSRYGEKTAFSCFTSLSVLLKTNALYAPGSEERVCSRAPEKFRDVCKNGEKAQVWLFENHPESI